MLNWLKKRKEVKSLEPQVLSKIHPDALDIVVSIQQNGFNAYLVGGCVRDILLGITPKDFDIGTQASPHRIKSIVKRAFIIGKRFRIVLAKRNIDKPFHFSKAFDKYPFIPHLRLETEYEITTFRRKPETVDGTLNENVYGTPEQDAYRRDFTINALFYDPSTNQVIDFVGGLKDLKNKHIKMIGNPRERFEEDPVRIFRALRFAERYNFKLHSQTGKQLKKTIPHLKHAKIERVREELLKVFKEGLSAKIFPIFFDLKVFNYTHPKYAKKLNASRELILKLCQASDKEQWPNTQDPVPYFYLWLYPIISARKFSIRELDQICDESKIFKLEKQNLLTVHQLLHRLKLNPNFDVEKFLHTNFKKLNWLSACSYVLKILSEGDPSEWKATYQAWSGAWRPFAKKQAAFVRQKKAHQPTSKIRKRRKKRPRSSFHKN